MKTTDLTTIGRPIDPEYPTNRAIAILTLVVILVAVVWQRLSGGAWLASALWGGQAGLTVFLTWALCRELDPDHPLGAFLAAGLALPSLYLWGLPQLGAIFWLLILVRVVNRTVGPPAGILDSVGLLGLATWLSVQGNSGYGAITAVAFLLDSQLPEQTRRQLVFALLGVVVTAITAIVGRASVGQGAPSLTGGVIALGLSLAFLPVVLASRSMESVCDQTDELVVPIREQTAQGLALLSGLEVAVVGGAAAVVSLFPLWAATLGASITWLYNMAVSPITPSPNQRP